MPNVQRQEVSERMRLHYGPTDRGSLRFYRGALAWFSDGKEQRQECYFEHPIRRWWGISGQRWFFGIISTDATRDVREGDKHG